jgi:hypothetical protein
MLPDSSVDPVGSKGYFVYSISPIPGSAEGTVIENTAGIYFDFNAPVITNTVSNTLNNGPLAICQDAQVYLDSSGNATLTADVIDNGSADFFGISALSLSDSSFTCLDQGIQQVTLYVTSVNSETDSCMANVTVTDNIAPVAATQSTTVYLDASGQAVLGAQTLDGGTTDNCGTFTSSVVPGTVDCSNIGQVAATVSFTDVNLNVSSALASVNVLDTLAPLVACHDTILFVDSTCFVSVIPQEIDNGSTDNCAIVQMNLSQSSFTCANVGLNSVVFSVTDASGNSSQCTSNITVIDVTGIKEISDNHYLDIHPNPSKEIVTLPLFVTGGELVITDLKGKVIYRESGLKSNELHLGQISQGTYVFVVWKNGVAYRNVWVKGNR